MTDKSFELTYSDQGSGFDKGKRYANPRFFSSVRAGVNAVTIIGDYPKIVEAYEAAGVPVTVIDAPEAVTSEEPINSVATWPDDLGLVDGATFSDEQLRDLIKTATGKAPHHKLGRDKLIEQFNALNAEPVEEVASNGLTRREIEADLVAMEVEFDTADALDDLAALRDLAREERNGR